jgi:hypothetical protein
MGLPVLEVSLQARLTAPRDGDSLVCSSVGPSGEAVAVWADAADVPAVLPRADGVGGASFAGSRALWPVRARVTVQDPDIVSLTQVARLRLAHPTVQPLPGGAFLFVGSRCQWHADGPENNAVTYGPDGKKAAEAVLGDGIEHVQADIAGNVWVGYFDEGIAGYRSVDFPGPEPMGSCGLARFTPELKTAWRYPGADSAFGAIEDCYALNVDGDTAWTTYYTSFPVVSVGGGKVDGWHNDVVGARAIAVAGARAALFSGYGANSDRLAVGVLRDGRFQVRGEFRVILPGGAPLPPHAHVIGRGPTLHFFVGTDWYQLTITDVPLSL